ncbi:hypothetical protein EIP91_012395 [Steccherinum ochraceum]|uniref:Xenotropic and polytropic retrovirus receptor 1 n=1 Tax=Steccherinum ochraceum TaxID=92696 RepID=A0A4R0RKJ1_9APHY|nr:hypothetical protein EIP91_012395 [Steccherinum ochraceum]
MKFARYLEETQAPEWKKAYIDYRGLKKRITACRKERERANGKRPASPQLDFTPVTTHSHDGHELQPDEAGEDLADKTSVVNHGNQVSILSSDTIPYIQSPKPVAQPGRTHEFTQGSSSGSPAYTPYQSPTPRFVPTPNRSRAGSIVPEQAPGSEDGVQRAATVNMGMLPKLRRSNTFRLPTSLRRGLAGRWELDGSPKAAWDPTKPVSLAELYQLLTTTQRSFFNKLDTELDKVEAFYVEREKEMLQRVQTLRVQLHELQAHRQEYYDSHRESSWMNFSIMRPKARLLNDRFRSPEGGGRRRRHYVNGRRSSKASSSSRTNINKSPPLQGESSGSDPESPTSHFSHTANVSVDSPSQSSTKNLRQSIQKRAAGPLPAAVVRHDPEDYYHAKKKLKKAVMECYRGLEILNNYQTLNIIGFRKALKKYEKTTKIPAQQAYTTEKIEPQTFSSTQAVEAMMKDLEELFAARFTRGDKKKALTRLRGGTQHQSHHFSTFRSGLMLGLAVPALVDGVVESKLSYNVSQCIMLTELPGFQHDTREALPAWDGLLFVYSILFVPVFFALLVGLNLQVWAASRINYVFIFELDLRTKLDHRQYYEIPAFLMCTLCYAFWLSFKRIGENNVDPTIWPLIWLALTAVVVFNPLSIWYKRSRYWLVKNTSKLLVSGAHRVEFADFWMGLIFTLSNLYFIPCAYAGGLDTNWQDCSSKNPRWGIPFLLAILPLLARAVQSVRRYWDSRLPTHLINGGKYATGVIYYLTYFIWRNSGGGRGSSFVAWIVFATCYSLYAGAWDLLMDWSLLRPHARYHLLRSDVLYTNAVPVYYFAIISNIILRFSWVFYIPAQGPNFLLRSFITAMLEVLRRWQWNFFRLENEHLGNVDQYRVTREVPLPYATYDGGDDSDDDEDRRSRKSTSSGRSVTSNLRWRRGRNVQDNQEEPSDQLSSD